MRPRSRATQGRAWVIGVHAQSRRPKLPILSGSQIATLSESTSSLHFFCSWKFGRTGPISYKIFAAKLFRISTHFARFLCRLSPFRMNTSRSVHSKQLYLPLESTLMKKRGRGVQLLLTRISDKEFCPEEHRDEASFFVHLPRSCRKGVSQLKAYSLWHSQSWLCSSTGHGSRNAGTPRIMCAPLQESTSCTIASSAAPDGMSVKLVTACGDSPAGPAPMTPNRSTPCSAPSISAAIFLTPRGLTAMAAANRSSGKFCAPTPAKNTTSTRKFP